MRITSLTVRNYRLHRERTVEFDPERTVIGGSNESGKSTLAEALHRGLFLKSRVAGEVQKSMVSMIHPGHPEVEVRFHANGRDFLVRKRFSGGSGTTTLTETGGQSLQNEAADTRLSELLGVECQAGGRSVANQLIQQWAHLWVWQGSAGNDPAEHATAQCTGLLQRLQSLGGAAVLQSELDARVAQQFAEEKADIFTSTDKPKAGSALSLKESAREEAQKTMEAAQDRLTKQWKNVEEFERATKTITAATADLAGLKQQQEALEQKLADLDRLRRDEERQIQTDQNAAKTLEELRQVEEKLADLISQSKQLRQKLQPEQEKLQRLESDLAGARETAAAANQHLDAAVAESRRGRLRRDLAASLTTQQDKDARLGELQQRAGEVRGLEEQMQGLRAELARLPVVDRKMLQNIQTLENAAAQAEAAQQAMAASIAVTAAGLEITLDGQPLKAGESRTVVNPAELAVGDGVRLRITPGGGEGLQQARVRVQETRQQLRMALDAAGIHTAAEAADIFARREDLSHRGTALEARLKGLGAQRLAAELQSAAEAATAAQAEVSRRLAQIEEAPGADSLPTADRLKELQEAVELLEETERKARGQRDYGQAAATQIENSVHAQRQAVDQWNRESTELAARMRVLLETHGEESARKERLCAAERAAATATETLAQTRRTITALGPEQLDADKARLQRAETQAANTKRDAELARGVTESTLRSDGTSDPAAEAALADARWKAAVEAWEAENRHAEAVRLLDRLFTEEQQTLAEEFTRPFAERISGYLRCLFGPGARAAVRLADNAFSGVELIRPGETGGAAVPFDSLSGGAREQVAAAVRLAMAEVLAADHGGCLPVVFDDAFAYSDPDRVGLLQRMLDFAASRGLQVIVLTCNPSDYAGLGAKFVSLNVQDPL
ncbi:MAG: AAA family ATPase [Verrucomicrobiales bacterium]|nr:AAA family ATPase [Verrucomicrobiales bacterium]